MSLTLVAKTKEPRYIPPNREPLSMCDRKPLTCQFASYACESFFTGKLAFQTASSLFNRSGISALMQIFGCHSLACNCSVE
ncbi:hypothetical protein H6F61_16955 [Cyanobacteria bacterium FACHB-472]|nr:hypothetical protein [Cyanobacteria bacterium FACHB-472]